MGGTTPPISTAPPTEGAKSSDPGSGPPAGLDKDLLLNLAPLTNAQYNDFLIDNPKVTEADIWWDGIPKPQSTDLVTRDFHVMQFEASDSRGERLGGVSQEEASRRMGKLRADSQGPERRFDEQVDR